MGEVIRLGVRSAPRREENVTLVVRIAPISDEMEQRIRRNMLHGLLSAFDFALTRGLFRGLFAEGGVFRLRCSARRARRIEAALARHMPELAVRPARRAA